MGRASTPPSVYGEGADRPLCYDVTYACRDQPHACRPRHAHLPTPRHARDAWEAHRVKELTAVKTAPPARAPILGLAQQRVALICGPGPGAPVGVQKGGYTFCIPITVHGQSEPWAPPQRA